MIVHEIDLSMIPGGFNSTVKLNQYDDDYQIRISLYDRGEPFMVDPGTTVLIRGTKPDGNGFSAECTADDNVVTVSGDQQMTAAAGNAIFEISLRKDGKELNTANFVIFIERAALDKDTVISGSQTRELVELEDNAEELIGAYHGMLEAIETQEGIAAQVSDDAASAHEDAVATAEAVLQFGQAYEEGMSSMTAEHARAMREINEAGTAIGMIASEADEVAARAFSEATNAANETAELANMVSEFRSTVRQLQLENAGYCQELEVDGNGLVYLLNNGERIAGPYGPFAGNGGSGGGGTGGNNAALTVANNTGWLSTTIADGDNCTVSVTWTSVEDDMPTGDGTARITVNGANKAVLNIRQGTVNIDISPYLTVGANVVKVNISDVYGNNRTIGFSVQCIQISISSTFDATTPYQGVISFPYTPVGSVAKTVHFILDGQEIGSNSTSVSGRQMSFSIPQQSHGAHTFECYFDCNINEQTVESNHLYYEIICLETMVTTPIIVSSFNTAEVAQYTVLHVDYTIYDPLSMTAESVITVNGSLAADLTVDRTQQVFTYRADDIGSMTIRIASRQMYKDITLTVTESDVHVEAETDQLVLYMASAGRSNREANPDTWVYGTGQNAIEADLTDFNFVSDGWVNDDSGVTVLRVSGDARVTIPYNIFANDFRTTGKTIEIEFATRDVMNYDSTILSCMSGGRGISMSAQLARLISEQSEISMQYKEGEHVRLAFVVEKRSQNRLIYMYVNGIMSGVVQYPANDDFSQVSPVGISIGSNDCTTDIYCIRVYDNNLTRAQILSNWIADTQDVTQMLARYRRNGIYDEYGNVVIAQLPTGLPYMIIECPELPQYKGDKKVVDVTYVDPVANTRSFTATGAQADVQGTSSQYYARKNYKIKFKNGFTLTQSGTQTSKYPLRPGAIPTNTFCFKADVASSEGANNVELARLYNDTCPYRTPSQAEDDRVRQGIDGFPIVIFWSDGENTTFLGKYNFNNDKGTEEVFGFVDGDESWEILNNTSDRVIWKSDDYESTVVDEGGNTVPAWLNDFEARYPDTDPAYTDAAQLKEFATWIKSTDTTAATNDPLPVPVTYGGVTYSDDTAEYRLAKFKAEIGDYVEMQSALFYYLFTELFLMVDSRAKNAFPSFMGAAANGGGE